MKEGWVEGGGLVLKMLPRTLLQSARIKSVTEIKGGPGMTVLVKKDTFFSPTISPDLSALLTIPGYQPIMTICLCKLIVGMSESSGIPLSAHLRAAAQVPNVSWNNYRIQGDVRLCKCFHCDIFKCLTQQTQNDTIPQGAGGSREQRREGRRGKARGRESGRAALETSSNRF